MNSEAAVMGDDVAFAGGQSANSGNEGIDAVQSDCPAD